MPKINVDGLNMFYEFVGQGEPLVLIGGLDFDHAGWMETQVPDFAAHYRCLVFDNRDVGQTDPSPISSYNIRQFANDMAGLMAELGVNRAHILGGSMGGMIAQEFALNYPERVASLTLVSTTSRIEAYKQQLITSWKNARREYSLEDFYQMLALWLYTYRFYEKAGAVEYFIKRAVSSPFLQTVDEFERQCNAILTQDTLARLGSIRAPTHVIVGAEDIVFPVRQARVLANAIPGAKLTVIPESAHAVYWEKASEFNQAVLEFLMGPKE